MKVKPSLSKIISTAKTAGTLALGALLFAGCVKTTKTGVVHLPYATNQPHAEAEEKITYAIPDIEAEADEPTEPNVDPAPKPSPTPSKRPSSSWPTVPIVPPTTTRPTPVATPNPAIPEPNALFTLFSRFFSQSVGSYFKGHLERPDALPLSGEGYSKIFQERNRGYGTLDLVSLIQNASKEIHRDIPATEVLQVGDLSDKDGGKLGGHASHQIGLDADIVYLKRDHREMAIRGSKPGETGFDENFVDKNGALSKNFDIDANWQLVEILVKTGRVERIFTDRTIKKAFCENAIAKGMRSEWGETLRKLQHWKLHDDHMHVRMTCPKNSPKCLPMPALPAGDGCDRVISKVGRGFVGTDGLVEAGAEISVGDGC